METLDGPNATTDGGTEGEGQEEQDIVEQLECDGAVSMMFLC